MRVDLIKIGNSKGLRLPKPLLEACGITDSIELEIRDKQLILSARTTPRAGWAEALQEATEDENWTEWQMAPVENDGWDWPEDFKWPDHPIVSTSGSSI
jgi:antitoxin MazE